MGLECLRRIRIGCITKLGGFSEISHQHEWRSLATVSVPVLDSSHTYPTKERKKKSLLRQDPRRSSEISLG